jgi:G:T/U-mismatch repair DNA glycosylase
VLPLLGSDGPAVEYLRLPSTSPAHAALSFEKKRAAWKAVLAVPEN